MLKIICVTWILAIYSAKPQTTKVDSNLASRLQNGEKVNIVVTFNDGVKPTIDSVKSLRYGDRPSRNKAIVDALKQNAENSQSSVIQTLSARSGGEGFIYFKSYWTSNKLFIKEADQTTVSSIVEDPQVARIRIASISRLADRKATDTRGPGASLVKRQEPEVEYPLWHLDRMRLSETYDELGGSKGEGIVLGAIDSGAKVSHAELKHNYLGEYGWYDGTNGTLESYDNVGHGSHTIGIVAGSTCGIAPGVKWMMCQACVDWECHFEAIMNCIQFMSCPTLPDGSEQDCSKAPQVVNFSIGGERDGEPYDQDFLTMKELGIIAVAAIGNSGPYCMTDNSPGNKPYVIGVGASTAGNAVWGKSSVGPAPDGTIKPDFVAPGTFIYSVDALAENDYMLMPASGSSCSAPHVAAIIALLHVRQPDITFEEAYELLKLGASAAVTIPSHKEYCNDTSFTVTPNNFFGYGWVSALSTVKAQSKAMAEAKI